MMRDSEVIDTVGRIYEAGIDPGTWSEVLGRVTAHIGVERAMMGYTDASTDRGGVMAFHEVNTDIFFQKWIVEYGAWDPWPHGAVRTPREGEVHTGAELLPLERLQELELYHDVLQPLGIEDCLCAFIAKDGPRVGWFNLYHDRRKGLFQPSHIERLRLFAPHLQRAARIHSMFNELDEHRRAADSALDLLSFGVVLCNSAGRIVRSNRAAERLFARNDGLSARRGELCAAHPADQQRLSAVIHAAGKTALGESSGGGAHVPVRRSSLGRAYGVLVAPVAREEIAAGFGNPARGPSVVVFITDPEATPSLPHEPIARQFGMTPAEARVAVAISQGKTIREYADETQVSTETVRSQLKSALSKTGVRRQAELVRVILGSLSAIGA